MSSCSEFRARARQKLGNNIFGNTWLLALVVCLIASAILSIANVVPVIGSLLVAGPISFGLAYIFLALARGKESIDILDLFKGFTGTDIVRLFLLGLIQAILIMLWSLLFIIPGIIKACAYSQAFNLAVDHPDWDWKQCLDESQKMMKGYKWKYFCLNLSFIGWIIVGAILCGIGTLWVTPYMQAACTEFYLELVGQPTVEG